MRLSSTCVEIGVGMAGLLQAAWRGRMGRQLAIARRQDRAAVVLQKNWRRKAARSAYLAVLMYDVAPPVILAFVCWNGSSSRQSSTVGLPR